MGKFENIMTLAGVFALGAIFTVVDYTTSIKPDESTRVFRGNVVEVMPEVYKKFGSRGRFTTKGEGFSAWIASKVQKGVNLGNVDVGYVVSVDETQYQTLGGIFFDKKTVKETLNGEEVCIISELDLDVEKSDGLEFVLKSDISIGEMIFQGRPKSLSDGENGEVYKGVLYHPPKLKKVEY